MPILPFFARFWPFSVSNDQIPGQGARRENGRYSVTPPGIIASLRRLHLIYMDSVPLAALWYASGDPDGRTADHPDAWRRKNGLFDPPPAGKQKQEKKIRYTFGTHFGFLGPFFDGKTETKRKPGSLDFS